MRFCEPIFAAWVTAIKAARASSELTSRGGRLIEHSWVWVVNDGRYVSEEWNCIE
jgi:hypothetical protein